MHTYSQISQDKFVNLMLGNAKGFFLDFGCGDGISQHNPCGNNTLLLEENGWDGLSIDLDPSLINIFKAHRKTNCEAVDLIKCDITDLLFKYKCPDIIDYFSFDIDGASEAVIKKFPFDKFTFKIITFEHDEYAIGPRTKNTAFEILSHHGYERLINNVILTPHGSVEDWYVKKEFFNNKKLLYLNDVEHTEIFKFYEEGNWV
jgi:hypothetical protein